MFVGLITSGSNPPHGGGVVVTKTTTTPAPSKAGERDHQSASVGGGQVKISTLVNPSAGGVAARPKTGGVAVGKTTGSSLSGKPKSFMSLLAGEGRVATGGGGKKATGRKGEAL